WFLKQGNPWARVPTLQWVYENPKMTAALAVSGSSVAGFGGAAAIVGAGITGSYAVVDDLVPAFEARLGLKILEKGWVALAGSLGEVSAVNTPPAATPAMAKVTAFRWIGVLDVNVPLGTVATISGKAFWGSAGGYGTGVGQPLVVTLNAGAP